MSIGHRRARRVGPYCCLVVASLVGFGMNAGAYNERFPPPPADKNVTISNGGLSVTFNIAWGAAVVAISDRRVDHGLNLVDSNDVGRELQPCQFLRLTVPSGKSTAPGGKEWWSDVISNPTMAGAEGGQPFHEHPKGVSIPEKGSPVSHWKAGPRHFHAVIAPLDYNTGKPSGWVYVEDVRIDPRGVAHFHYTFYNHGPDETYKMGAVVATLYTDRNDAFMYPLLSPYGQEGAALRRQKNPRWPVKRVTRAESWPQKTIKSHGWIANIDTADDIGIFYTTPVGMTEDYVVYPSPMIENSDVSDRIPLGQTLAIANLTTHSGGIYSIDFSVLVSTPRRGPALIAQQPAAVFKVLSNSPPAGSEGGK